MRPIRVVTYWQREMKPAQPYERPEPIHHSFLGLRGL
jgi:hypothetical protein